MGSLSKSELRIGKENTITKNEFGEVLQVSNFLVSVHWSAWEQAYEADVARCNKDQYCIEIISSIDEFMSRLKLVKTSQS